MTSNVHDFLVWGRDNLCSEIACNECPFNKWYGTHTNCGADCLNDDSIAELLAEMTEKMKQTKMLKLP